MYSCMYILYVTVFAFQVAEAVPEPEPADQPTPQNNPARGVPKSLFLKF